MHVDLGILGKLTRVVVFLLFIAGVLAVGVWYLPLIKHNEKMRKELLDREEQIRKVEDANRQLKASIESLKHDPKAVERLARERLHYAKPGETVIRFEDRSAAVTSAH
jgi:cell division protein FtsB